MKRVSFLFLMLILSFFAKANVWENINKPKSSIDFEAIANENIAFEVKLIESGTSVKLEFWDRETNELANSLIFDFDSNGVCEKLFVKFTCEDCYYEHLEKLSDLKLLKNNKKRGFVVRSHFKDFGDYVDYSIMFVSKA